MTDPAIRSVLKEDRLFPAPADFVTRARIHSRDAYDARRAQALASPEAHWAEIACELHWYRMWDRVLDWKPPHARWFGGATTNLAFNCLDRHLHTARRHKAALVWEGEPGDVRTMTYAQLHREVCLFAGALEGLGVRKGDRVAIYMGMVPEAAVAMLACARIGAVHSVVFGGFAAEALRDRINDAGAKVVITQDASWRRGKEVPLKVNVDRALEETPSVEHVVVLRRTGAAITRVAGRDHDFHELLASAKPRTEPEQLDAEHPLFILYTSGTTGKPKGVVHTTGGYMVGVFASTRDVFDLREEDLHFCTADIGWVTGHSYVVYGPLLNGATSLMYEGAPDHPDQARLWSIIERHGASILYTAPTAIRAFMKWGDHLPARHDLSSLRLLGTVGEPINPEAWTWYHRTIGGGRCPVVDTWWQTETGAIMIAPMPAVVPQKPGSATLPLPGIDVSVVRHDGTECGPNEGGLLLVNRPWPSMLRTVWGDDARYVEQYWARFPGRYLTGDGARRDEDGYLWLMGRIDDVVNVAGHRLGTAEVESALVSHPAVAEAAVVARPDELKGEALVAFVTLKTGHDATDVLKTTLADHVAQEIGKFAKPDVIRFAAALPKTRSGKIMRRLLREVAQGKQTTGDTTTLEDLNVLATLRSDDE
ncbi:MAG: acetate--CoA ligase [Deltaproteobacteria bacterium]|nr:acetate--CoA ligase [Deltaproteobacteria bacterium]